MQKEYYQICLLLNELGPLNPRLDAIRKIVNKPDFVYKKEEGADIFMGQFIRSSYWLSQELFDEKYLYKKSKQNLTPMQSSHLKMADIGVELLSKGFPVKYNTEEYAEQGPNQLAPYVKTFVEQCHKKYAVVYNKTPQNQR